MSGEPLRMTERMTGMPVSRPYDANGQLREADGTAI